MSRDSGVDEGSCGCDGISSANRRAMSNRIALVLVVVSACGDDAAIHMPDAQAEPDAPRVETVRIGGTINDLDPQKPIDPAQQPALAGVQVCLDGDSPTCTTTDSAGRWMLDAPKSRVGLVLTYVIAGRPKLFDVFSTLDYDELDSRLYLPRDALASSLYTACGSAYPDDSTSGGVMISGTHHTPPDYVALDGGTAGASAGTGPCYWSGPWTHDDPQQLTTRTSGYGFASFMDVPAPGNVDVDVRLTGSTCSGSRDSLRFSSDGKLMIPTKPGFITLAHVVCE
jgi:hypothetical protein